MADCWTEQRGSGVVSSVTGVGRLRFLSQPLAADSGTSAAGGAGLLVTELAPAWDSIVARSRYNPSLGSAWFSAISEVLAPPTAGMQVPVGVELTGEVKAVVPYFKSTRRMLGIPLRAIEAGSNLMSYHAELLAPGHELGALEALIRSTESWDLLSLRNVPAESCTARAIRELSEMAGLILQTSPGQESPFLLIEDSWEDYLASRHKKFRYKHRQRAKQVESLSSFELRWFDRSSDTERLLGDMLIIEQASWKSEAGVAILAGESEFTYHKRLLPLLAEMRALQANVLYHLGRPVAYSLCCLVEGWMGHLKTSFDKALSAYSVGAYVIDTSVERAFRLGAREFDFLGDMTPHKLAWTGSIRRHHNYFLFGPTAKGRLVGASKKLFAMLRPVSV